MAVGGTELTMVPFTKKCMFVLLFFFCERGFLSPSPRVGQSHSHEVRNHYFSPCRDALSMVHPDALVMQRQCFASPFEGQPRHPLAKEEIATISTELRQTFVPSIGVGVLIFFDEFRVTTVDLFPRFLRVALGMSNEVFFRFKRCVRRRTLVDRIAPGFGS